MADMNARPILFSGEMIRAFLDGRKTQTRRVITPQPKREWVGPHCEAGWWMWRIWIPEQSYPSARIGDRLCPYGQPGDLLWVRETCFYANGDSSWLYAADGANLKDRVGTSAPNRLRWRPAIHMPRRASRITLELTGVSVERVQDISQSDAMAEGAPPSHPSIDTISREYGYEDFSRSWFAQLWDSINAKRGFGWKENPWVWALTFRVHKVNVDSFSRKAAIRVLREAAK